ncbi:uncharacterized protein BDZ99DRAFT_465569, partial [Mytilinidion resinicola]
MHVEHVTITPSYTITYSSTLCAHWDVVLVIARCYDRLGYFGRAVLGPEDGLRSLSRNQPATHPALTHFSPHYSPGAHLQLTYYRPHPSPLLISMLPKLASRAKTP